MERVESWVSGGAFLGSARAHRIPEERVPADHAGRVHLEGALLDVGRDRPNALALHRQAVGARDRAVAAAAHGRHAEEAGIGVVPAFATAAPTKF